MRIELGLLPQAPVDQVADLAALGEELGFGGIWVADSQAVFRDAWITLGLCAVRTQRLRLATGVTNPVTRNPAVLAGAAASLAELSGGRAVLGIGVGESAVRTAGLRPATLARLEEAVAEFRERQAQLAWSPGPVPVVIAATGPKALELAGRIADGVLIQVGSSLELVHYALERIRRGARGRPVELLLRLGCAIDEDRERARADLRSYAAAAARTIAGSVPAEELSTNLRDELRDLVERYDYDRHVSPDAAHAASLPDSILDAVGVAGTFEEVAPRLRELASLVDALVVPVTMRDRAAFIHRLAPMLGASA